MTFRTRLTLVALLLSVLCALPLFGGELVLVPVWYEGNGAQASRWTTNLSVYNSGGYFVPEDGNVLPCLWLISPCPRGFFKDMMMVYGAQQSLAGGFVMRVPSNDNVSYALRIFEAGAQLEDLGVDVPVVRERDLKSGPVQLMNVPASDPNIFRYMLRIYGLGAATTPRVRINGYVSMGDGSPDLVITRDLVLTHVDNGLGHYYGEDTDLVRQLIIATGGMGQLRVEVEPMSMNLRWWAMLSATNNRTQDVTIITPH